jgi:hypothetical protein
MITVRRNAKKKSQTAVYTVVWALVFLKYFVDIRPENSLKNEGK